MREIRALDLNGFYLIALPLALQLNSLRIHLELLHLNEHMDRDVTRLM